MSDRNLADLCPELQPLCRQFIAQCAEQSIKIIITETYRSDAEQDADYAKGRTQPGKIITNARGGQSKHNCVDANGRPAARAFDFAIVVEDGRIDWDAEDKAWQAAIAVGESLGLISGSEWHMQDCPHMELADVPDNIQLSNN